MLNSKQRPLSWPEIESIPTVAAACEVLRGWGRDELAERIAYFASDEDLEDGDVPVTLESVLGFLAFFGGVESDGKVDMACSPEGCLSAVWRFPEDRRRACVWFLDKERVMFSATDANGKFLRIEGGSETGDRMVVMERLVGAGLFAWRQESPAVKNSHPSTTLPGTAGVAT